MHSNSKLRDFKKYGEIFSKSESINEIKHRLNGHKQGLMRSKILSPEKIRRVQILEELFR